MSATVTPLKKTCIRCGLQKSRSEFPRDLRNSDGLMGACKECENERNKDWQSRNPAKVRNYRRARYSIHFNMLWVAQNGLCALCHEPMLPKGRESDSVCIDHDRSCCPTLAKSCGKCVRGLLHHRCNLLLGHARDTVGVLELAVKYLDRWRNKTLEKGISE